MERGLTQDQLAELIGKTTEHISFLERAERSPSLEVIMDLVRVLNVPISMLLDDPEHISISRTLGIDPLVYPLPEPVEETSPAKAQQQLDVERLNSTFKGLREAQTLATEYGISDVLQESSGKLLQVLIVLGLRLLPNRSGTAAADTEGNTYEIRMFNRSLSRNIGIPLQEEVDASTLAGYRAARAWFVAVYEGVTLKEIYRINPADLESLFRQWEKKLQQTGSLKSPRLPLRYVRKGQSIYPPDGSAAESSEPN